MAKNLFVLVSPIWRRRLAVVLAFGSVIACCVYLRMWWEPDRAQAEDRAATVQRTTPPPATQNSKSTTSTAPPNQDWMASVNGEPIDRDQLASACVKRHGDEVLESLVNKRLILHHCRNRGIEVAQEDIAQEIERMAKRFKLGRQQYLELLERERGIPPEQYARDIVWPTLALRKLAAGRLQVTDDELRVAYETEYGEAIDARLIVVDSEATAKQLHQQLSTNPNDFARLAIEKSQDVNSASIGGMIQPIRRHVGDPAIESAVFQLRDGEVSQIIPVGNQFAILRKIRSIPPRNASLESVRDELAEKIKDAKLREVSNQLFAQLQSSATIVNILNDREARQRMPGVVATVNGDHITMRELKSECLLRYGEQDLEVEIAHRLLSQALNRENLEIGKNELRAEVAHAARLAGVVDEQGQPNFDKWYELVAVQQKVSREQYVRDSVWPSAALKQLTRENVEVTQEDLQKAFQANYGERVRCRAIVLGDMRRAQTVWAQARQNPSADYFGDLAAEYSIDQTSRSLRGEVPPIRRHGGQPQLEAAAFQLRPGQLSGIVQVGDKFVILRCEGHTDPVKIELQEVRDILQQDIYEKKLRVAMSEKFDALRQAARIDNYLTGTSETPSTDKAARAGQPRPINTDGQVRPAAATQRR